MHQAQNFHILNGDALNERFPTIDADDYRARCLSEISKIKNN